MHDENSIFVIVLHFDTYILSKLNFNLSSANLRMSPMKMDINA